METKLYKTIPIVKMPLCEKCLSPIEKGDVISVKTKKSLFTSDEKFYFSCICKKCNTPVIIEYKEVCKEKFWEIVSYKLEEEL